MRNNYVKIAMALLALFTNQVIAQNIMGIDVSDYQGTINWTSVKSSGITFAYTKATESTTNTQTTFSANIINGEASGVYMGAYHFARILTNPGTAGAQAEANHFLSVAQSYIKSCQMPPALDYEVDASGTYSWADQATWIETWCNTVKSATGITPIIYSGNTISENLGSYLSSQYKLWFAYYYNSYTYTTPPPTTYDASWGTYKIWQYSDQGTVSGISGGVDMDIFNGTMTDLTNLMVCNPPVCHTYYASLPYSNSFENAWITDSCSWNAQRLPDIYWKSSIGGTTPNGNDYWHREDYTGADWTSVTTGTYTPAASVGNHSARFHNDPPPAGSTGALDLYVNLSSLGKKYIKFDYIHSESSASPFSFVVLLSTDGGSTFPTTLYTITTASVSSWTTQTFTTNATSATSVLRFIVTDKGAHDVGIDNLSITTDTTVPTTTASVSGTWETTNFTANFTDVDNTGGSGIEKSYYQAIYYDGTKWGANYTHGFFANDFNTLSSDWTSKTGTWSTSSNTLNQTDTSLSNTNIYAPLTQTLSNRYLYSFTAKIGGTGTNRRAGFHFFCDQPDSSNRNNSYFVWFRADKSEMDIYKVVNNVFTTPVYTVSATINANQAYNYIIIYDRISGLMRVYQNNVLIGSWTDSSPLSSGGYISFRTGNATLAVQQLRVYRSRVNSGSVSVTVGSGSANDLEYQNTNPTTPAAHINSVNSDSAANLSAFFSLPVNIDWTPPVNLTTVNNVIGTSIDSVACVGTTSLSANWSTAVDTNSAVSYYEYAIGTTPGAQNITPWTNNGTATSVTKTGLTLTLGSKYYFSVKAVDGAGIVCDSVDSKGIHITSCTTDINQINGSEYQIAVYPNPTAGNFIIEPAGIEPLKVQLYDMNGRLVLSQDINGKTSIDAVNLNEGVYYILIQNSEFRINKRLVIVK